MGGGAFEEVEASGEPAGESGLGEVIEDVAAFAAFVDEAVRAEEAQMLGDTGVGDTEDILEGIDVFFAVAELFNDADAMGVGEDSEEFGEFFGDDGSGWHRARTDDTRFRFKCQKI